MRTVLPQTYQVINPAAQLGMCHRRSWTPIDIRPLWTDQVLSLHLARHLFIHEMLMSTDPCHFVRQVCINCMISQFRIFHKKLCGQCMMFVHCVPQDRGFPSIC